jgi:tubulin beta
MFPASWQLLRARFCTYKRASAVNRSATIFGRWYATSTVSQAGRINVIYFDVSGGKYVPRAVLFDLEPGLIVAVCASALGEFFRPENLVNPNAGAGNN